MGRVIIRRIFGHSMLPTLRQDQIVLAIKRPFRTGDVVIAWVGGREVIKRVTYFDANEGRVVLHGDNESDSTDSRHYGPVTTEVVCGVVIWPRKLFVDPDQRMRAKHSSA